MHVHYSLAHAAAGDPYLAAGQNLEFVIKVPENMMPVSKNRRLVLVPVEAAYSDDEQEVVVAQENRQVWSSLPIILLHMLLHTLLQSPELHHCVVTVMQSRCKSLCLSATTQEVSCASLLHMCSVPASSNLAEYKAAACTTQSGSELHTYKNLLPDSIHAIKSTKLSCTFPHNFLWQVLVRLHRIPCLLVCCMAVCVTGQ